MVQLLARIAQAVQRFPTGWTVRGSNPVGGEIFRTRPDRPCGPPRPLYNGHFAGVKRPERVALKTHPHPAPKLKKENSYTATLSLSGTSRHVLRRMLPCIYIYNSYIHSGFQLHWYALRSCTWVGQSEFSETSRHQHTPTKCRFACRICKCSIYATAYSYVFITTVRVCTRLAWLIWTALTDSSMLPVSLVCTPPPTSLLWVYLSWCMISAKWLRVCGKKSRICCSRMVQQNSRWTTQLLWRGLPYQSMTVSLNQQLRQAGPLNVKTGLGGWDATYFLHAWQYLSTRRACCSHCQYLQGLLGVVTARILEARIPGSLPAGCGSCMTRAAAHLDMNAWE